MSSAQAFQSWIEDAYTFVCTPAGMFCCSVAAWKQYVQTKALFSITHWYTAKPASLALCNAV